MNIPRMCNISFNSYTSILLKLTIFVYFTLDTQSYVCVPNQNYCVSCANANNCGTCVLHFGLANSGGFNICSPCSADCFSCAANANQCTTCSGGFHRNNAGICLACNNPNGYCWDCPASRNVCTQCQYYYRVTPTGDCQRCSQFYCLICDQSASNCTYCYGNYGVNGTVCVVCGDPNCLSCGTNYQECTECDIGFGVNSTNQCSTCSNPNCIYCSYNQSYCYQCVLGYGASGGSCVSCDYNHCIACRPYNLYFCTACKDGYGASSGNCYPCTGANAYCAKCSANYYNCTSCVSGYGLSANGTCVPCQVVSPCSNCAGTNPTLCGACIDSYYFDGVSACVLCPQQCLTCFLNTNFNSSSCTSCKPNYGLTRSEPKRCDQICGDFFAYQTMCDNQVGIQYDGCTDLCQVQYGFQCTKQNNVSVCSYQNQTIMEIVSIVRQKTANSFTMKVNVWPPLYVFRTSQLLPVFRISNTGFTITSAEFDYASSQFVFKVDFSATCWDCEIVLEFIPDSTVDERYFASVRSQASITVQLFYYSDFALKTLQFTSTFCTAILAMGGLATLLGIFAKRLPGIESIVTCQIAVVSIIWINTYFLDPFMAIHPLQYALGYYITLGTSTSTQNSTARLLTQIQNFRYSTNSPHLDSLSLSLNKIANSINILMIIQGALFFVSVIVALVAKCLDIKFRQYKQQKNDEQMQVTKDRHNKVVTFKEICFQCLMYFTMLNLVAFTTVSVLFFQNKLFTDNTLGLIILAVGIFLNISTFVLFWVDADPFDYFRYSFRRTTLSMSYYFIYILCIICSIVLLQILSLTWPPLIPIGCLLLFTIIYRPYRQIRQNLRASFNLLIMLGFFLIRIIINEKCKSITQFDNIVFILYFIDLALLLLSVAISIAFLVYHIIYVCSLKPNQQKSQKEKVMMELQQLNVKLQMKQIQAESKQTIFGKFLTPNMNLLQFSNIAKSLKDQKLCLLNQSLDNQNSSGRMLRKNMKQQTLQNNYGSTKTQDFNQVKNKVELIDQIKIKMETGQGDIPQEQIEQNKKLLYAMQVLDEQNQWIKLKNARDYTLKKIKEGAITQQFIQEYQQI